MSSKEKVDERSLSEALASSSLSSPPTTTAQQQLPPTTIDALPNDVLVSIFSPDVGNEEITDLDVIAAIDDPEFREAVRHEVHLVEHLDWVKKTFPLVCRRWRDLYRERQASPLHTCVLVCPSRDRATSVLSWARRHAVDVRELAVAVAPPDSPIPDFTADSFGELVAVLGPHLTHLRIMEGCGPLLRARFWSAVRDVVVPARKMRSMVVAGISVPLPDVVVTSSLAKLTSLETLRLMCSKIKESNEEVVARARGAPPPPPASAAVAAARRWGFSSFPEQLLSLPKLDRLVLQTHHGIASIPPGISKLKELKELLVCDCSLRRLPPQLGALSKLTRLDVGRNVGMGHDPVDAAFPDAALGGMTSLRNINLAMCFLRAVPQFVWSFGETLEVLNLSFNAFGVAAQPPRYGFPASLPEQKALTNLDLSECFLPSLPSVVLSAPRLKELHLSVNKLSRLPRDLGEKLPRLETINLAFNEFAAVPVAALRGATSLKKINISLNEDLQLDGQLMTLLKNHPMLVEVKLGKESGSFSRSSLTHLAPFVAELEARGNPDAATEVLETSWD